MLKAIANGIFMIKELSKGLIFRLRFIIPAKKNNIQPNINRICKSKVILSIKPAIIKRVTTAVEIGKRTSLRFAIV